MTNVANGTYQNSLNYNSSGVPSSSAPTNSTTGTTYNQFIAYRSPARNCSGSASVTGGGVGVHSSCSIVNSTYSTHNFTMSGSDGTNIYTYSMSNSINYTYYRWNKVTGVLVYNTEQPQILVIPTEMPTTPSQLKTLLEFTIYDNTDHNIIKTYESIGEIPYTRRYYYNGTLLNQVPVYPIDDYIDIKELFFNNKEISLKFNSSKSATDSQVFYVRFYITWQEPRE